jgi:uncharacterized protein DUF4338
METSPVLLRYRNREIRESDLAQIRSVIAGGCRRRNLAVALCQAWQWRQPNGRPAEYACRDLLLRLDERGLIQLPQREQGPRQRKEYPLLPADLMPLAWLPVNAESAQLKLLEVRPTRPEERSGVRLYLERYHYLGYKAPIGEHLFHAAFLEGELVALLAWAAAAAHAPARERYVGWDEETRRKRLHLVTNNVRYLVMPWVRVPHLASKVLALSLRRLRPDWIATHGHPVWLAETFVDTSRFRGTCYRAANWKYLGHTAGRAKRGNQFLVGASSPKALYVYELHRRARALLCGGSARCSHEASSV